MGEVGVYEAIVMSVLCYYSLVITLRGVDSLFGVSLKKSISKQDEPSFGLILIHESSSSSLEKFIGTLALYSEQSM